MEPSFIRLVFLITSNLALYLIIHSSSKISKDHLYLSWPALFTFLAVSVGILIAEECFYYLQETVGGTASIYVIGNTCLLTCSILTIHLFHFLSESSARANLYKYEISLYTFTLEHQSEFKRMYESFTAYRHDLKHHLEALDMLIAQKATKEAQAYLEGYKAEFEQFRIFTTGSPLMDALLTAKVMTMKENGIQFHYVSYPLNRLPIEETKLCAIVGNLLDNAIEGVLRIEDPSTPKAVSLRFSRIHDVFRITCTNPCNTQTLRREKDTWRSSKREAQRYSLHGIGISNINRLVDEANGFGSFTVRGDVFHVSLSMPFPKSAGIKEAEHEPNR